MKCLLVLGLLAFLAGCGGTSEKSEHVSQGQWGVQVEGALRCDGPGWVTFEANGTTYAVNGMAKGHGENPENGLDWVTDQKQIEQDLGYVDWAAMIDRGLKLCE